MESPPFVIVNNEYILGWTSGKKTSFVETKGVRYSNLNADYKGLAPIEKDEHF